jgi:hypothetical protein
MSLVATRSSVPVSNSLVPPFPCFPFPLFPRSPAPLSTCFSFSAILGFPVSPRLPSILLPLSLFSC